MRISLGAKQKLGFIDGTMKVLEIEFENYKVWQRCDYMVTELCLEIAERYGKCNGPMIYEIWRIITSISQENVSVSVYFTRLRQLWDELSTIEVLPPYTCGVAKIMDGLQNKQKVIQFLMRLNDAFEPMRNRVLMMDPLPSVSKAYSMVVKFEAKK
uniref:Retrotransposon gag domain-containing protein n=1 Tax=Manihot esculenta TaxID=3983 RepID=A0A2C9V763_MANES